MPKPDLNKRIALSFHRELFQIHSDLNQENRRGFMQKGLNQFHLRNRDCADFVRSDPTDRLIFANQSGLFPEEK